MKRLADQTLYEILEIPQDAPAAEVESASERARAIYGPGSLATYTLMTPEEASLLTSRIEEARRILLDPDARARYDASLAPPAGEARAEVVRAVANGAAGGAGATPAPAFGGLPPVIPAVHPSAPPPAAPVAAAPPPAEAAEPPAQAAGPSPAAPPVIRLDREVAAPAAAPSPPAEAAAAPAEPAAAPAEPAAARPAELPLPEGSAWTGEALRRVREARGITVPQIAERTKVTRHHVENVEAERFSALPAQVYLRGILLSLARELRLDGQKVAKAYLERMAEALGKK